MPFGAAGLSTSRTAVSRFTAVLSEEANCAGASGAVTAARQLALLTPAHTNRPAKRPINFLHQLQRDVDAVNAVLHTERALLPILATASVCTPL